jgi:hypothetical protein
MSSSSHRTQPHQPSPAIRTGVLIIAAGLCLVATVAIWALLTGSFEGTSVRVLLSGLAAALCTLGGLAGATVLRRPSRHRHVGEATLALSQLTLMSALALIWIPEATDGEGLLRTFAITTTLTLAGAHASLLLARLRAGDSPTVQGLARAAIVFATSAALLLSGVFTVKNGPVDPAIWRLLGVLVVLAVLSTLLVPLARRISRHVGATAGPTAV